MIETALGGFKRVLNAFLPLWAAACDDSSAVVDNLGAGAGMIVIYEDASMTELQPAPQQLPLPPATVTASPESGTLPEVVSFTSAPMGFTGNYTG